MNLDALTADEISARLSGSPEARAELIRAGAEAGVAEAQCVHGQALLDAGSAEQAFEWFMKAAAQRHVMAINMVGRCYDQGWGAPVDKGRAAACFRSAAEAGLAWGMYNYATALTLGDGVAEDKQAALAWLRKAAATGNAKALNFVGSFYEDGWVVDRDMAAAADFYAKAAEGGDFRGAFNHARMLIDAGRLEEALPWIARAGADGTPAFVEKAALFLAASPVPEVAVRGVAALRGAA